MSDKTPGLLDKLSKPTETGALVKRSDQPAAIAKSGGFLTKITGKTPPAIVTPAPAKPQAWKPMASLVPQGRLAFVIDATQSRSQAWKEAQSIQRRMFSAGMKNGNFTARVVYYQGGNTCNAYDEWTKDPAKLQSYMADVECITGNTQIIRALDKCLSFTPPPNVILLTGDCCEESMDKIQAIGKVLGERKIPVFAFLDGDDANGKYAFETLAKLSGGAFAKFGAGLELGSAGLDLGSFVAATAAYSSGGIESLQALSASPQPEAPAARLLTKQLLALPPPK